MADTGWLRPSYSSAATMLVDSAHAWSRPYNISNEIIYGANSWTDSKKQDRDTDVLLWNWSVPDGSFPDNAVVVGIEVAFYGYYYQHNYNDGDYDFAVTYLQLGDALILNGTASEPTAQVFRIQTPQDFPDRTLPLPPEYLLEFGGPTELFTLVPGTRVSDYLQTIAYNGVIGERQCSLRMSQYDEPLSSECGAYTSSVQLKIHYEVPTSNIDMESSPEVVVSVSGEIVNVNDMDASPEKALSIPGAALGGQTDISASPVISLALPADISEGYTFIDSTAYPQINLSINPDGLQAIRNIDMQAEPRVNVSFKAYGAGKRIDIASSPLLEVSLDEGLTGFKDLQVDEEDMIVVFTFDDEPDLEINTNLASDPFMYLSIEAKLEGDIYLGSECEEFIPIISLTIDADLGYTKGLDSNPSIYLTMDVDGLTVGTALEFSPLISLTIPRADLRSKYAEPAPDHRTYFLCPEDRTIVITRKDKTIL